jgi:hypothetical protein
VPNISHCATCAGLAPTFGSRSYLSLERSTEPRSAAQPGAGLSRRGFKAEPVICIDEKSLQLIGHSRAPLPMTSYSAAKHDYEYTRNVRSTRTSPSASLNAFFSASISSTKWR